ncbi:hypothetical protein ACU8V7_12840 [Zobellia nedashkovskayae]
MKKDIEIPIAKDVQVAIIREWNEEFLSKDWNAYIINNRADQIEMVMVVSKGFDEERQTTTMRHSMGTILPSDFKKIELLQEEVLALDNEFFVTFFAEGKLFEKRFLFPKNTVSEKKS